MAKTIVRSLVFEACLLVELATGMAKLRLSGKETARGLFLHWFRIATGLRFPFSGPIGRGE
jgi:hypothetical protein